jgi:transcriptional regulator with XRE-family HTH domain
MMADPYIESQIQQLGKRLKWARELVEPNRAEFARSLGVDHSTIRNIENGTRGPSVALLMTICHSLRISFEYLLQGELRGVDGELAALLSAHHPELRLPPEQARSKLGRDAGHSSARGARTPTLYSSSAGR